MIVTRGLCSHPGQPITKPFPDGNGVYFACHGGDVLDPVGIGTNWFYPPYPKHVLHWFCRWSILPFFAWRYNTLCGYIGYKPYGVDAPVYRDWLCDPAQVYEGSHALCLTIRNGVTFLAPVLIGLAIWGISKWI